MKKLFTCLIILFGWINNATFAQKINLTDISKILLTAKDGGMNGGREIDVEIVKEHGHWNSYQIMKDVFNADYDPHTHVGGEPTMHSTERKQIATLTKQQIIDFLNSVAIIKPQYSLNTFNFFPAVLIAELRKNVKGTVNETPKLEDIITEVSLQQALAGIIKDESGYDAFVHCDIRIVKANNDVLKMQTEHLYTTMLPWKINGQDSYDMNINRFFIAAMGKIVYPNKEILGVKALEDEIYNTIDRKYSEKPIATYRWNYTYADNVNLLKNNFTWVAKQPLWGSMTYRYTLQSNIMPSGIYIEATLDIADRTEIEHLIAYSNLATSYLKADNFVFKYYRDKPNCNIRISYNSNDPVNGEWEGLQQSIPYLQTMEANKVINFSVYAADDYSHWLLLPNN